MSDESVMVASLALLCCTVAANEWWRERRQRQRAVADYQARLRAALAALGECQAANDGLQNAVREREQAIGGLLRKLNAANVRAVGGERLVEASFVLGLPMNRVNPSWFSRN